MWLIGLADAASCDGECEDGCGGENVEGEPGQDYTLRRLSSGRKLSATAPGTPPAEITMAVFHLHKSTAVLKEVLLGEKWRGAGCWGRLFARRAREGCSARSAAATRKGRGDLAESYILACATTVWPFSAGTGQGLQLSPVFFSPLSVRSGLHGRIDGA